MTVVAVLLIAIGTADIARLLLGATLGWRFSRVLAGILGILVGVALGLGAGLGAWVAVSAFVPVWLIASRPGRRRASIGVVGLLGFAIAASLAVGSASPAASGPLLDWYDALPYGGLTSVPLEAALVVIASTVFLIESANVIVRLALAPIAAKESASSHSAARTVLFRSPEDLLELPLPGGRLIGPLERILILTLALAGQFTATGAVVAAKGIIRFPEISKDTAGGSKAEFFIVGSLASWVLVAGAAGLAALASG